MALTAYLENDNVLTLAAKDSINGADLSGATVTYDLQDSDGNSLDSGSMTADGTDSNSNYLFRATLADTISITAGTYYAVIELNAGAGLKYKEKVEISYQERTS